jgi:hypothetical protein
MMGLNPFYEFAWNALHSKRHLGRGAPRPYKRQTWMFCPGFAALAYQLFSALSASTVNKLRFTTKLLPYLTLYP